MVDTSRDALCSKHPRPALLQNDCGVDSSIPARLFGWTHAVQATHGLINAISGSWGLPRRRKGAPGISIWRVMADKMVAVPGLSL